MTKLDFYKYKKNNFYQNKVNTKLTIKKKLNKIFFKNIKFI